MRRTPPALAAVAILLLLPTSVARADYRIDGRGWGHGIGLSQYGAQGLARDAGRDFRAILRHYYAGTRVAAAPRARMRVRLRRSTSHLLQAVAVLRAADGRVVRVRPDRTYRVSARGVDGLDVADDDSGRVVARLRAPVRATGTAAVRLLGRAENGVSDGRYRGAVRLLRDGTDEDGADAPRGAIVAVNDVDLEHYLYGVVPGEMPAAWHPEALKAQAVVARSYALRSRSAARAWDVWADTRSQMYRGLGAEQPSSTAAVRATRRLAVYAGTTIAQTFFFSTSGGRTAAIEEVWNAAPLSYLRSTEDPFDAISPYHTWTVRLTDSQVAKRLDRVLDGELLDVAVVATTPSGRVAALRVSGTLGTRDIRGDAARTLLGLRSTWFSVTPEDPAGEPAP